MSRITLEIVTQFFETVTLFTGFRDKRESFFKVSHSCIKCFLARREGSVRTGRTGAGHIFAVDFIHLQLSSV